MIWAKLLTWFGGAAGLISPELKARLSAAKWFAFAAIVSATVAGGAVLTAYRAGEHAKALELAPEIAALRVKVATAEAERQLRDKAAAEAEQTAKKNAELNRLNERHVFNIREELRAYQEREAAAEAEAAKKGTPRAKGRAVIPGAVIERVRQLK